MKRQLTYIVLILAIIFTLVSHVSYSESVAKSIAINFMNEARCPFWTFSFDNMQYESITDDAFRQAQSSNFPPIFFEDKDSTLYWNQYISYDIISNYNLTLVDQIIIDKSVLHDSAFDMYSQYYTLDLYSVDGDYIIVAHNGEIIVSIQYVNAFVPVIENILDLSSSPSYYHYIRSTHAINSSTYTLTAFYTNGTITTITCDANSDDIISITNEANSDSLITLFDIKYVSN